MDWSRAKSVLIISFLLLNVLLGYQLWLDVRERLNTNVDLTELTKETQLLMQQKNIEIKMNGGIPTETPALKELSFRFETARKDSKRVELGNPVDSRIVFSDKDLRDTLGGVVPDLKDYRFDQSMQANGAFVFYRVEGGYPMFEAKLSLYYSNQKITAYEQDRVVQISSAGDGDSKGQAVLSATKVIERLVSQNLQPGAVIKDIRLGYHGQIFNDDQVPLASPTWRVLLEDGKIYYMNAISGDVESGNDGSLGGSPGERTG